MIRIFTPVNKTKVMKAKKLFLTPQWVEIKQMFEANTNGSKEHGKNFPLGGELDELTQHFLGKIALITLDKGFDAVIEGVRMDVWKERIWSLIQNAGLLPEIAWKEELEDTDSEDTWYITEDEFDEDEFDRQICSQI